MKIQTRLTLAQEAPKKWARQYSYPSVRPDQHKITEQLAALDSPIDPDQVDAIIGNKSWTEVNRCSECGARVDVVVEIGEEPDYESLTAWVCLPCLRAAVALAEAAC